MSRPRPVVERRGASATSDVETGTSSVGAGLDTTNDDQWSPSASGTRGLSLGRLFLENGTLVASLAQEGPIRPHS